MATEGQAIETGFDGEVFQAQYILRQKPPPPPNDPSMKTYISTFPPLGQVTPVTGDSVTITALLEVDESRQTDGWEVSLWSTQGGEWEETSLCRSENCLQYLGSEVQAKAHLYFTSSKPVSVPSSFTIKFRAGPQQSWKWANEHQGSRDGTIVSMDTAKLRDKTLDLADYVQDLNDNELTYRSQKSQSPDTALWEVDVSIDAAIGEKSTFRDVVFGLPWGKGKFSRWFSLVRLWQPWLAPRQGKSHFQLDKDGIMVSFLSNHGQHLVLLAISGTHDVMTVLKDDGHGKVVFHIRNDGETSRTAKVLVGLGNTLEAANAAVMYHARNVITAFQANSEAQTALKEIGESPDVKTWQENWYDALTYCTWNALGQRLTEEKVLHVVDELARNNINVTNFIIDDNWQDIDYRGHGQFQHGWNSFQAEPKAFPHGLKHTVDLIRKKHPSIQHVAVWHALLGYWGGLSPDGKIAQTYKTVEVVREDALRRNLPLGGTMTVVAREDVNKFYDDFYRFLSDCGVDGVKTDAQFMTDAFISAKHRRDLITAYSDAWSIAHYRHFSMKAISCMSQTPDILFHAQLPQNRLPILVRNSDDFFPEIPASHPWHIFVNAHNAIFTQHLNVIPDWDMFQTIHEYSGFHAAARCVSGGPIYITDVPGVHDLNLIGQMTGTTVRGKTVIFRTSVMGKSLKPYNAYEDDVLLQIGTYHGQAITGTGMIGFFNVSQRPLSELVPISQFPGVVEAQLYVVRAHSTGKLSTPLQVVDPNALIYISLDVRGYEIFSAYPLRGFYDTGTDQTMWLANLGLVGKMAAAAAVSNYTITKKENGQIVFETALKALGVLGVYISTLPALSFKDRILVTILDKVIPVETIRVSTQDEYVLEIDVETAWKEMKLHAGWSNEVHVKLYLNSIHDNLVGGSATK